MLISVIIPIFNAQEHLEQCIRSVMSQTLRDIEIICIDDGSTDRSPQMIDQLAQEDPRLIVQHVSNGGAGKARNIGLRMAKGKYLSFLDADDFFEPEMLEKAYIAAEKDNAQVTVYGANLYNQRSGKYYPCSYALRTDLIPGHRPFASQDVAKDLFRTVSGWTWDKLFLASYVQKEGFLFQEQRTTNDAFFVFCALVKACRITTVDTVLVHQRRHAGITLSVSREQSWTCFYQMLVALKEQLITWGLYQRFEQDYINYALHFSLWNLNTLHGKAKTDLYNRLKNEWFDHLLITQKPRRYFYSGREYAQMRRILHFSYSRLTDIDSIIQRILTLLIHRFLHR